jgi:shikimate kinase
MGVIGTGSANGACSLIHAAGIGYGASLGLELPVKVRLLDAPVRRKVDDPDALLDAVFDAWTGAGHPLPAGTLAWSVRSDIPPRQGLKSSAAVAVAALRALADATDQKLSTSDLVELAGTAQLAAGVSITGAYDDAWAAAAPGWRLVDVDASSAAERVVLEGEGLNPDDWRVLILTGPEREQHPPREAFLPHAMHFQQALIALQEGRPLVALTQNGRGVVAAIQDNVGRQLANHAFVNGGRAAGISGSGPAIVIVVPAGIDQPVERLRKQYAHRSPDRELIETRFVG